MSVTSATTEVASEMRAVTARLMMEEPEEIRDLRTGAAKHRPGSYGQYFTAWDLANGILRDYAMNLYQLLRLAADGDLDSPQVIRVLRSWHSVYRDYLECNGFLALARYATALTDSDSGHHGKLIDGLAALTGYVNRLTAWSHHYFPWHLGADYRYGEHRPGPRRVAISTDSEGPLSSGRGPSIRLHWEPLGIDVTARLQPELNEQLCAEFLEALPFTVLQQHAVVTGESMYAWTPLVSVAPTPIKERICDAPVGRLRFSQATGNKLIVQYGPTTETLYVPVLGMVARKDIDRLPSVGRAVWDSAFHTKDPIWLTVDRL